MLPWETLFDGEEFLAAGAKTSLSRLPLDIDPIADLPAVPAPVKMLVLVSSPLDLGENERLDMEQEQQIILQATDELVGQGLLHVEFEDEVNLKVIENCFENGYQILHFSGHGIAPEAGGGLLLEDAEGNKKPTEVREFLQSIEKGRSSLRLVVISGCQTAKTLCSGSFQDVAHQLARHKVPSVIAMQFSISDTGGLMFAEEFYPRVISGRPLEEALSASRRALMHSDNPVFQADALAPVLLVANNQPLKTTTDRQEQAASESGIDFSFYLPLPQLDYEFYGRRREYRAIRNSLLSQGHRAVILYGLGGIGKTALVSHVAKRMKDHFQGVYAFDCSSGTLAPEVILHNLHRFLSKLGNQSMGELVNESLPPEELANYMSQALSQFPLLIIFDNFESLLSHAEQGHRISDGNLAVFLDTLIRTTSRGSKFLFTSRYSFDLEGKRIGGLREIHLTDLSRPEALGLMQKLPHLAAAPFVAKNRVFDIFGGHPYAIVTLDRHCAQIPLENTLDNTAPVQEELRGFLAIQLNYDLLSETARKLLNRLAAFRKPVPFGAAEWVLGRKVEPEEILARLDREKLPPEYKSMSDEQLLEAIKEGMPEQREAGNIHGHILELIRWGLLIPLAEEDKVSLLAVHNLVRDFCKDKLGMDTWREFLRDAALFYTNRKRFLLSAGEQQAAVMSDMEAVELLIEAEDFDAAAVLLTGAFALLTRWGLMRYSEAFYLRILPQVTEQTLAVILQHLGILYGFRGEYDKALEYYEKSLKIDEELGNRRNVAGSLHEIGRMHQARGAYDQALEYYEKSLKINEEIGNRDGGARSLHQIGIINQQRGNYDLALNYYEKSLKIKEELGNRAGGANSLHQIGMIHQMRGAYNKALEFYEKSLIIMEEIGDRAGVANSLGQIGIIHQQRGNYDLALDFLGKVLKSMEELGNRAGVANSLHQIGIIHQLRSEYGKALEFYEKSLKIMEEIGDRAGGAGSLHQIGMIHRKAKKYPEAFSCLANAFLIFAELKSPDAKISFRVLKELRDEWGIETFDAAWREKTGHDAGIFTKNMEELQAESVAGEEESEELPAEAEAAVEEAPGDEPDAGEEEEGFNPKDWLPNVSHLYGPEELAAEPEGEEESTAETSAIEVVIAEETAGAQSEQEENYAIVKVFFATDRKKTRSKKPAKIFGAKRCEPSSNLSYGICDVSIPKDHEIGELEAPSIRRLEFRNDPTKHVVLLEVSVQKKDDFFSDLASRVSASPKNSAFIFVHGYHVTFEDAARRTAQMCCDLEFDGAPVFYSWPSTGSFTSYTVDQENAEWTQTNFKEFLEDFLERSNAEDIYLIAHSMGSRTMTNVLKALFSENPEVKDRFREVILAAPDIDAEVFKREIAPALTGAGQNVTLYASSKDKALSASQSVHGYPRAGDSGDGLVVVPGVETIDATNLDTGFISHSYFAKVRSVISDLFYLISEGRRPDDRFALQKLKEAKSGYYYWEFKK
ncbi:tetratricopeptide repeat protein [Gemmatimonadota bacterium]